MGRQLIADGRGPRLTVKFLFLPFVVAAMLCGAIVPMLPRARTVEANEFMLLKPPPIDGKRAFKYLEDICKIGPRTAGSAANKRQREMVAAHFTKMGAVVSEQSFRAVDPMTRKPLVMANLIGSWFPDRDKRVVIGAHYDSRPHADQEVDPERLKLPFIGANDGASGVALLMEIAHRRRGARLRQQSARR
jgi:glutaminyl-peptide cyclotransferase